MFASLEQLPADPILGLSAMVRSDTNPNKVDLGVGVYKDDLGRTPILNAIDKASAVLLKSEGSKAYVPPEGWPGFGSACSRLVFGIDMAADLQPDLAVVQTPGGCGALRLGFDFIKESAPDATVWVSDPTWANHVPTIKAAGLKTAVYPYYDKATSSVNVAGMIEALKGAKAGDVVLLHACCHNPTGADIAAADWDAVIQVLQERALLPFLDMAYQGFAEGVFEDAAFTRQVFAALPEAILSYSCSKNFGLYRERTGALLVKGKKDQGSALSSHLCKIARTNYSMPPAHGAALVTIVAESKELEQAWLDELAAMRGRVNGFRKQFDAELKAAGFDASFAQPAAQTGMFSLLNLTSEAVLQLRKDYSIYFPENGRINMAGFSAKKITTVVEALRAISK